MRKLLTLCSTLCLMAILCVPASALEYTVEAPSGLEFASATSVEPVLTADRGERPNEDLSKTNPVVAPAFGSNTSYLPGSGEPLCSFLNVTGAIQRPVGNIPMIPLPNAPGIPSAPLVGNTSITVEPSTPTCGYTEVTGDMYYTGDYLGRIKIPSLGVNVKVYQGTDSSALAKGAGHFENTSIWEGNVCIAGHNRGAHGIFGDIHTLKSGDAITLTTKSGARTYSVFSVDKVKETDTSMLGRTVENQITLLTCVTGQSTYRWCVQAMETFDDRV
jgi:sortase A